MIETKEMARIYISSTYEDLKKEREATAQAVRRLGHQPVYMEDYVAEPQRPVEKCLQDVRSCDAYVGIFAWRYGFIPDGYDKSITHLEYETSKKAGIPCLIFITDIKARWPAEYVTTGEERTKIDQLRNELTNEHEVSFFKHADELSGLVSPAVSNLISDSRKPGKDMEEIPAASKSIAIGIQKTGKEKLIGPGDHEPQPGINTDKAEINDPDAYGDEKPPHTVYLDGYWLGKYEVTLAQYKAFISETGHRTLPSHVSKYSSGDNYPVVWVSREDASSYCKWLSGKLGVQFKLPTEAQWEKAARGIDSRKYPWGNKAPDDTLANFGFKDGKTTPVGSFPKGASPFGLLDMAGNVFEWCNDWYDANSYRSSPDKNPTGPESGTYRVLRGGSSSNDGRSLRCTYRGFGGPSGLSISLGFRLCQDI